MTLLRPRWRTRHKDWLDVVQDDDFWHDQRQIMLEYVRPVFLAAFLAGARLADTERAVRIKTKEIDEAALNEVANRTIMAYSNDWWEKIEPGQRDRIRKAVIKVRDEGGTLNSVIKAIAPDFGRDRAKGIAITEMTNLMGAGAQAQYRLMGYTDWEWRTVSDGRVCPDCEARDGQQFPMNVSFEAAHPGCRCWPVPAGDLPAKLPEVPEVPLMHPAA